MKDLDYQLIDSGNGWKLERFGKIVLVRPAMQALYKPHFGKEVWAKAHAHFSREKKSGWEIYHPIPPSWNISVGGVSLKLKRTDFGHLGFFPEHTSLWPWMQGFALEGKRILNLFAYSGASTIALASKGAQVTHVDAAKGMVQWASENVILNRLESASIRWLVDDVRKYLNRAVRRGERFDAILLDPPTFGRGKVGEVFKIESDLPLILEQCRALLTQDPLFFLLTCHTPGYTPLVLQQMLQQLFPKGKVDSGEMMIKGVYHLPCGSFAKWRP